MPQEPASPRPSIWRQFPRSFWIANVMEIFERMGWYGFYAVSSLYLTGAIADGGLGFSSEDRGVIQGLATFFLYLVPALFGALADRYGYKRMFLASCAVMIPGYLLLGTASSFWAFFAIYFLVALGHGMFKPVVISTVAKTTDEKTGTLGFGVFYMMVNIGGFIGPIVAGVVRGWDWQYVFYASAAWIGLVALSCALFYREPPRDEARERGRTLGQVLQGMIGVVGNGRFFLLIAGLLTVLIMGSKWWSFALVGIVAAGWLGANLLFDLILRARRSQGPARSWLTETMRIGEGRYLLFLFLMAGFWTSFNQIFITLPEFIRDYVNTSDLVEPLRSFFEWAGVEASSWERAVLQHGQVKPEHLINLNAFGIIVGQIGISYLARNLRPFTTIVGGILVTVISFVTLSFATVGWMVVGGILIFSVGEMLASPKSKEYAGRIAPPDKVGMYMGYFYWCVALGNLFGGLLSGVMYQHFGPKGVDQPAVMWAIFAALGATTAAALWYYNRWISRSRDAAPVR